MMCRPVLLCAHPLGVMLDEDVTSAAAAPPRRRTFDSDGGDDDDAEIMLPWMSFSTRSTLFLNIVGTKKCGLFLSVEK